MYHDRMPYQTDTSEAGPPQVADAPEARWRLLLRQHWSKLVAVGFWLLLIAGYLFYTTRNNLTPLDVAAQLIEFLHTPYGPLLYIVVFVLRPLVFFSATLLTVVAGSIFGPLWAIPLTMIGSNASATLVYLLGNLLGRGVLDTYKMDGKGTIRRYAGDLRRNSFQTVLTLNLMMLLPFDLISYTAGFLHLRYRPFILGTLIGSIPGIVACVLLGSSIQVNTQGDLLLPELHPGLFALAVALIAATMIFSRYLRRRTTPSENGPAED